MSNCKNHNHSKPKRNNRKLYNGVWYDEWDFRGSGRDEQDYWEHERGKRREQRRLDRLKGYY